MCLDFSNCNIAHSPAGLSFGLENEHNHPLAMLKSREIDIAIPEHGLNRRGFLSALVGAPLVVSASGLLLPESANAQSRIAQGNPSAGPAIPKWPGPSDTRQIWIKRQETGEVAVARYFENGRIRMQDYLACCHILRDVRANVVAYIDMELLDLIFAMQNWLVSWGIDVPMIINSGYRTDGTNDRLEGASRASEHKNGRATDNRMQGIPADYVRQLASIFSIGGVGYYAARNFTHLDTGKVRYWRGR